MHTLALILGNIVGGMWMNTNSLQSADMVPRIGGIDSRYVAIGAGLVGMLFAPYSMLGGAALGLGLAGVQNVDATRKFQLSLAQFCVNQKLQIPQGQNPLALPMTPNASGALSPNLAAALAA